MDLILHALESVGFNWHVALFNFINFVIVLLILKKLFWKKIGDTIEERANIIKRGLTDAKNAEIALNEAEIKKASIIGEAKQEASLILNNAANKSERIANDIRLKAESDARNIIDDAHNEINVLSNKLHRELEDKAPQLVNKMITKLLKEKNNEDTNNKIVESLLS